MKSLLKQIDWKYTFGEISIVIIGISIAFAVNQCSENQKDEKRKDQYLRSMITDLKSDTSNLNTNIFELQRKLKLTKSLLTQVNATAQTEKNYLNNILEVAVLNEFVPQDITYKTLINSGDLSLFNDIRIKTAIQKHYNSYEQLKKTYLRQENIHKTYLADYFINDLDYRAFGTDKNPFKNEKILFNILQSKYGAYMIQINASKAGVENCTQLILLLSDEIH